MERKLIANHLVPDDEVWVSPKTWDSPFTQNVVAQNSTDIQHTKATIALQIEDYLDANKTQMKAAGYEEAVHLMEKIAQQ